MENRNNIDNLSKGKKLSNYRKPTTYSQSGLKGNFRLESQKGKNQIKQNCQ